MILDGITKNLKNDNNALPPVLDKGILASTIQDITDLLKENPKARINFYKLYQTKLMKKYASENNSPYGNQTGWIIIPSNDNDPQHFEENVKKLKTLSHDNWCTKTFNAKLYLEEGDFHVYLENGKPKLGVRFDKDVIQEIQGEKNDKEIPLKYLSIAQDHVKDSKLSQSTEEEFEIAYETKEAINDFKAELSRQGIDFETCTTEQLLNAVGIKTERNEEGKLILDCYKQPDKFTFEELGINENKLLKDVVEIKGDADFRFSELTKSDDLRRIGGNANFTYSEVKNLNNLKSISGNAYFSFSKIENLNNLESVGGDAYFWHVKIENLNNLISIGGNADFRNSKIRNLKNLESIGGKADFRFSIIENLNNLISIGRDADFRHSKIRNLNNLESIGRNVWFEFHNIQSAGRLKSIGGDAYIIVYTDYCMQNNLCESFVDENGNKKIRFIGLGRFEEELKKIANGVHLEFQSY